MPRLSESEIREILARTEALPEDWFVPSYDKASVPRERIADVSIELTTTLRVQVVPGPMGRVYVAEAIAGWRTDVPALAADLLEARAERAEARAENARLREALQDLLDAKAGNEQASLEWFGAQREWEKRDNHTESEIKQYVDVTSRCDAAMARVLRAWAKAKALLAEAEPRAEESTA